ncbi:MAG: TldD/PmbA family protein [Bacteroidales bacterium]|nr:TldD/PmbA family protein [Bacteroidales bacterium]
MNEFLDIFGVSLRQLEELAAEGARSSGWCDLYFENTVYCDLLLRDGAVASGGFHTDYGCGIRVLDGEKTGYAYSESTDYPSLLSAARAAAAIADGKSSAASGQSVSLRRIQPSAPLYGMEEEWFSADKRKLASWLGSIEDEIRRREAGTLKVIALLSFSTSDILMYNSLGELSTDSRPLGSVSVTAVIGRNGKTEQRMASKSFRCGAEMLTPGLRDALAAEIVDSLDDSFAARHPKGGKMPVVMAAGASGILLHEAMGHAFEADFNRKGQSVFSGRIGERICRKGINIIDDATIPGNRGSLNIDDEGVPGQKTYMVQDGILNSYLHDRISAKWYGVAPTGNGRRESFRYNPIPRMRATYMESGSDGSLDDLISSVKKGIYVDRFANGEVKIGEGDFTFYVNRGYLIENGRLTMPVKDINIIGNGPRALSDIVAVAGDLRIDDGTWTCGKEQSVAVSCGIPSVLVKELTVGGQ